MVENEKRGKYLMTEYKIHHNFKNLRQEQRGYYSFLKRLRILVELTFHIKFSVM